MAETCRIERGKLCRVEGGAPWELRLERLLLAARKMLALFLPLAGCGAATWLIFLRCVSPAITADGSAVFPLLDRITTGALFATFGSAVVAVFTLFSSRRLELFQENLSILTKELSEIEDDGKDWRRWSFLPRLGKVRFPNETWRVCVLNSIIRFAVLDFDAALPLPTTIADFSELPIFRCFLYMKIRRREYLRTLYDAGLMEEYPAWDCACAIYRDILLYRLNCLAVWVGSCLVFHSIVFSFAYPAFYYLMT